MQAISESIPSQNGGEKDAPDLSFRFPLKDSGEYLSLSNVVFWWGHPAALRRIHFSAVERLDIQRWYGCGYGKQANVTTPDAGTLHLSIEDAGNDIEENLEIIRRKHLAIMSKNDPLRDNLPKLNRA